MGRRIGVLINEVGAMSELNEIRGAYRIIPVTQEQRDRMEKQQKKKQDEKEETKKLPEDPDRKVDEYI